MGGRPETRFAARRGRRPRAPSAAGAPRNRYMRCREASGVPMSVLHEEWQPWRDNPVLRLALAAAGGVLVWAAWQLADETAGPLEWALVFVAPAALFMFFLRAGLRTRVTTDGLAVQMIGLRSRRIAWSDIEAIDEVRVRPLRDFGGWGIRYGGRPRGWMYNVRGQEAVRVRLRTGKTLYVGSQDAEALVALARTAWPGAHHG